MILSIDDIWGVEILIPIECECILLLSNSIYSKIKRKIANVRTKNSREMLEGFYQNHFRCRSRGNEIALPYSIVEFLNTKELNLIKFKYENENAFFVYGKDNEIGNRIWKYLTARSFFPEFIEVKVKNVNDEILHKEENKFAALIAEAVVRNRGEIYNPVSFYGEDYFVNSLVTNLIVKSKFTMKTMNLRQLIKVIYETYRANKCIDNCAMLTEEFQCLLIENFDEFQDDKNFYMTNNEVLKILKKLSEKRIQIICTTGCEMSVDSKFLAYEFAYIQTEVI